MLILKRDFIDRSDEIKHLEEARLLVGVDRDALVCLHGQIGIGKTQLLAKYQRQINFAEIPVAYVDLPGKNYLSVIDEITFGLGSAGFEALEAEYDKALELMESDREAIVRQLEAILEKQVNQTQEALQATGVAGLVFNQAVTGEIQYFINGKVTFNNAKIELIFNIERKEPGKIQDGNRDRITRTFFDCLRQISRERQFILLLDHWEGASTELKPWLDANLVEPVSTLALKQALVVVARVDFPEAYANRAGVRSLAILPFTKEAARQYWGSYSLPQAEFDRLRSDVYGLPSLLSAEASAQRVKQAHLQP